MRIDFDRLILLLLIVRLRTVRIFSYLQALIKPIVSQYEDFNRYAELRRLRASATPQALMIEKLVYAETGVSISIVPVSDFASPDFEVIHSSDATAADVLAARSVVDRYKLAGVTYRIQGSVIPFSAEWTDKVCALSQVISLDSADWADRVCAISESQLAVNDIRVQFSTDGTAARVYATYPVASTVSVSVDFQWQQNSNSGVESKTFTIVPGDIYSVYKALSTRETFVVMTSGSVTPSQDSTYQYYYTQF